MGWPSTIVDDADRPDIHLFSFQGEGRSMELILEKDNHVWSCSEDNEEVAEHKLIASTKYLSIFITVKRKKLENILNISPLLK